MAQREQGTFQRVPSRWLNCPRKSLELIMDKFLALKVPLSEEYDDVVPPQSRFTPQMLIESCQKGRINLGLWIDLTNTKRFYRESDLHYEPTPTQIRYVKIACRGHGQTPSREQTMKFIDFVDNYIRYHPLHRIAVHCTHGFNRTGYMIVSYLVDRHDMDLASALRLFAQARPPGIYKPDYLQALHQKYNPDDVPPTVPELPDWCYEDDETAADDDEEPTEQPVEDEASTSKPVKISRGPKRNKYRIKSDVKFMFETADVIPVTQDAIVEELQLIVKRMCCKWQDVSFPGCQPVSMNRENIYMLAKEPYRVSWKADGVRYMMLIRNTNAIYFFDRDFNVFQVHHLTFPHPQLGHLIDTLLDGEMVIDQVNGRKIPRYLVYDIVWYVNDAIWQQDFHPNRMDCIEHNVIRPRYVAMQKGRIERDKEPFSVRKKDFWDVRQAGNLLGEKFAKSLSHEPDGLIFQPARQPYKAGRCDTVLKWKPLELNSVDFRLKLTKVGGQGIIPRTTASLHVLGCHERFDYLKYTKELKNLDDKIVECTCENGQWKFLRERTDKSMPNHIDTATAVLQSIRKPVDKTGLLFVIENSAYRDDVQTMPPPSDNIQPPRKRVRTS